MAGFQPLIIDAGQIERAGSRRTEIRWLNFGPLAVINVTSSTITATQTLHFLQGNGGPRKNVDNILGGQESDLLIVGGNNVRLRSVGNLVLGTANILIDPGESAMLIFVGSNWFELSRNT